MRFVILGAGAVGATIGGRLADTDHDVLLVARGEHLKAPQHSGLRLAMPDRVISRHVPAAAIEDVVFAPDDVLIVATKQQDGEPLLRAAAASGFDLPVFCAQNGVDGERMALRRFPRVYGVCVMLPAVHLEPGRVAASGTPYTGSLDLGCYPRGADDTAHTVAEALRRSGFLSTVRDDVMPWKYAKLLRNLGNALEALGGSGTGADAYAGGAAASAELAQRARNEARAVWDTAGISWTSDAEWHAYRGKNVEVGAVEGAARAGGSSWQSAARGLGSIESDHLNGEVVLVGRLHGVPTPVNALLQREANALVRRGDPPGSVDLAALLATLDQV
jgi:2-dehydropantoate 2-reductase